ncbi:MAG TPA: SH3 domain-containing protein [Anaerolineales bacterium]|nr:SH3 domain-containing protein [Anaerolineales bacterium]
MSLRFADFAIVILILSTSCTSGAQGEMSSTFTPSVIPSTLPGTMTSAPSETPLPASPQPTVSPVEGVTSDQVNVRLEPSTASTVLGIIPANTRVEITGRDPGGSWWQIIYPHPQGIDGKGWVTAQYITTAATPDVPAIVGGETNPNSGNIAVVQQQINVRSGPGTDFNSLGTLNPQDVLYLTGKDPNGAWLQIEFAAGPAGKGWVNAAFVQAQGVENLPIIAESGQVVGTGTPTVSPATPTPTIIPAPQDGDSGESPIASVIFEPTGTNTFIYNGDLSAPQGDSEDWIAFKPYGEVVFAGLECTGSAVLAIEIWENNSPVNTLLECGDQRKELAVQAASNYLIHLQATPFTEILQYTIYTLTIKTRP